MKNAPDIQAAYAEGLLKQDDFIKVGIDSELLLAIAEANGIPASYDELMEEGLREIIQERMNPLPLQ